MSNEIEFKELLERAYSKLNNDKVDTETISVLLPKVSVTKNKRTLWENFSRVCGSINREPEMVKNYIVTECIVKCSICGIDNNQLLLKGRYTQKQIETVLVKFIKEYVRCYSCKSLSTKLNRQAKLLLVSCNDCQSVRNIVK